MSWPNLPKVVNARTILELRSPSGEVPCADGLAAALAWIGDRSLPLEQALMAAAADSKVCDFVAWAREALGLSGYGDGDGDGDGDGNGYGYGDGDGNGNGYGDGDGDGDGNGYGDGDGDGNGNGYGDGNGYGRSS